MQVTFENYTLLKNTGLSRADIAKNFNIPEWKLKKLISINGWGTQMPKIVNTNAFDDYNEMSCYWAGYLQDFGTGKKWQIKYNTNDSILLLNYLYSDSNIHLDRKYALYQRIVVNNNRMMR